MEDAVERNQQGDDQGAADRIAELRERINDLSENNEIGSGLADRLRELVDRVRPFQE